jgi:hypothetical protein
MKRPGIALFENRVLVGAGLCVLALSVAGNAHAGAYISSSSDPTTITHPSGYTGSGGVLTISVCTDPNAKESELIDLVAPNLVATWNALAPTSPNLLFGGDNNIPFCDPDWESTALHEVGHCIGLAHPNLASESGLDPSLWNYTKTTTGGNSVFDVAPGVDGIIGSSDDVRGDDENRVWFRTSNNNPFTIEPATIDASTYSVDLGDLPGGHLFAANPDRSVGAALGFPDSEAVMQQGSFCDEDQRSLGHDDVATISLAAAGLDETQGTGDDYTINLEYDGYGTDDSCDLILTTSGSAGFAFCSAGLSYIGTSGFGRDHFRVTSGVLVFDSNVDWFYNVPPAPELCPAVPMGGCRAAGNAQFQVKDKGGDKDQIKFKWSKGPETLLADFLDPTAEGTDWSLCIYDGSVDPQPLTDSYVASGGLCSGKDCWRAKSDKGFDYKRKSGYLDGITQVKLGAGAAGKSRIQVKGKGSQLTIPSLPLTGSVTVQLIADDGGSTECWDASFASPTKNEAGQYKAKFKAP